jgi:hypothetical protein
VSLDGLPAGHVRVLLDGLSVFEQHGLLLAGGTHSGPMRSCTARLRMLATIPEPLIVWAGHSPGQVEIGGRPRPPRWMPIVSINGNEPRDSHRAGRGWSTGWIGRHRRSATK